MANQPANFNGTVTFTQGTGSTISISIDIPTITAGAYQMHVHNAGDLGDMNTGLATGFHFNGITGPRPNGYCEVGMFNNNAIYTLPTTTPTVVPDTIISFAGMNNIVGRSLILHLNSTGARVAQCIIGVQATDPTYLPTAAQVPPPPPPTLVNPCAGVVCVNGACNQNSGLCVCQKGWGGSTCQTYNSASSLALSFPILFFCIFIVLFSL